MDGCANERIYSGRRGGCLVNGSLITRSGESHGTSSDASGTEGDIGLELSQNPDDLAPDNSDEDGKISHASGLLPA